MSTINTQQIKIDNLQDQGEATFDKINGIVKDLIDQQKQNPEVQEAKEKVALAMSVADNTNEGVRETVSGISGELKAPSNIED